MKEILCSPSLHHGMICLLTNLMANVVIFSTTDDFYHFVSFACGVVVTIFTVMNLIKERGEMADSKKSLNEIKKILEEKK